MFQAVDERRFETMMQVLHVDDETDDLIIGKELLERDGSMRVDAAADGKAALERMTCMEYDAVVSALQMSGMDGIALLKVLRQAGNDIPFIIFSDQGNEEAVIEAINNGADFYLRKGSDVSSTFAELQRMIIQAIARRRERLRVAENEGGLRAIIESSSEFVWEADLEGRYTYLSPNSSTVLGRHPAELLGTNLADLVAEKEKEAVRSMLLSAFERGERISGLCYSMCIGTERTIEVETSAVPVLDLHGGRTGFAGTTREVALARKPHLHESEQRFRGLVETSADFFWELDGDHRFVYASSRCETVTGFTPAEMLGGMFVDRVPEAEREAIGKEFRDNLLREAGLRDFQSPWRRKDGTVIILESNATVMRSDGTDVGVRGQSHDASRRLAAERASRNANARLSLLSSITRHDIMNQVMVLKGYLELQESMSQDERRKVNLVRIREAADRIQEQLAFAKQYERMGLDEPAWIPLEMIWERLQQEAGKRGVACALGRTGFEVYADNMLDKVFFNLLDNSMRHGKRVTRISLRAEEDETGLRIVYEDNGVGVAARDRPKLFQRGFGNNTGMGLFLAKEILGITDLSIEEDGAPGTGVRFRIHVPRDQYRTV